MKTYERTISLYPVFVYGTLLSGCGNNSHFLAKAGLLGKGKLIHQGFKLLGKHKPFPFLVPSADKQRHGVKGEVYLVTASEIDSLDALEGTPVLYERKKVIVTMTDTGEEEACYAYVASPSVQAEIKHLTPVHENSWKANMKLVAQERADSFKRGADRMKG